MGQQFRALHVTQELDAEAVPQMRAFNKTWDVRDYECPIVRRADDAEVRLESGERIVGDFWFCRGYACDQGGLSSVRESDQADVGEQLELQAESLLLAGLAVLVLGGGLMRGGCEPRVAASSAT